MTITIQLDPTTAGALAKSSLYAFRATSILNAAALPTVWSVLRVAESMTLRWAPAFQAYVSTTPVAAGNRVVVGESKRIVTGATLEIAADATTTMNPKEGSPGGITFQNDAPRQYTCGVIQPAGSAKAPFCAFPVGANQTQGVVPADPILLFFSTAVLKPGTIVTDQPRRGKAPAIDGGGSSGLANQTQGVLVLDTSEPRALTFSIQTGLWTWGDDEAWAQTVAASAPIVPLLIRST